MFSGLTTWYWITNWCVLPRKTVSSLLPILIFWYFFKQLGLLGFPLLNCQYLLLLSLFSSSLDSYIGRIRWVQVLTFLGDISHGQLAVPLALTKPQYPTLLQQCSFSIRYKCYIVDLYFGTELSMLTREVSLMSDEDYIYLIFRYVHKDYTCKVNHLQDLLFINPGLFPGPSRFLSCWSGLKHN